MFFKRNDVLVDKRGTSSGLYLVDTVDHNKIYILSQLSGHFFWGDDFFYRIATNEEKSLGHRIDKQRPISRKRKRKLQKKGKTVYWSKHLDSYVYVMEKYQ